MSNTRNISGITAAESMKDSFDYPNSTTDILDLHTLKHWCQVTFDHAWQAEIWPFFSHRHITSIVSWLENSGCYVIKLKNTLKDSHNSVCQARPVTSDLRTFSPDTLKM